MTRQWKVYANKEKNAQIVASLNKQLKMKKPGRDVLAMQAATTSVRFNAKQLSELITPKIEGVGAYALLQWATQQKIEWVQADCIFDLDDYGPGMRTLVNWISQGPGRKKTAKYLDLLYRAVNPNIKHPLSTRIVIGKTKG